MAYEILIWRDQLEAEKEDSKSCKAPPIKASWVGAGLAREVGYAVRSAVPTCFGGGGVVGGAVEFHMGTSQLADNNGKLARDTLHS